jgi:superfamily II DNA or RNA helicase
MSDRFSALFDAVRGACSPQIWSSAVELGRAGAVVGEPGEEEEVVFRVAKSGGMISHAVTFFLDDAEWDCECPSPTAGCEHVAAAIIAWRRAREEGRGTGGVGETRGRVGYRFSRSASGLAFERVIVRGAETHVLETTLAAVANRRVDGPRFVAAQADLAVELALSTHRNGVLPAHLVRGLFKRLALCGDVRLDDAPVAVSPEPIRPHARLVDHGDGFRLTIEDAPDLDETFVNGVGLCAGTLRPIGDTRLTGRELHELPRGRRFGPAEVAELVTEVLPSLRRRITVDVLTERLPETSRQRPRIAFETKREGIRLSVMATLVYGDPPRARVDAGRLVHLEGPVPLRDEEGERRLVRRLRESLELAPGVRAWFDGEDAVSFRGRLVAWEEPVASSDLAHFRLAAPLVPHVEVQGDRLVVDFETSIPGDRGSRRGSAEPAAVLAAFREGASLVPLVEGGWAPLPHDWLERYGGRIADLLAAREADGEIPRVCLPDLALLCEDLDQPPPPGLAGLKGLLEGFGGIPVSVLPDDLRTRPRDYQRQGVDWLVFLRDAGVGAMLADDMGLGKTLQALCAVRGRTLVVAPTSVLHNWIDEVRRHRPGLSTSVYHGPRRSLDSTADVTVTTYALLRLDADVLAAEDWDTVVLDEAQAIKNPDSRVAAAAFRLRGAFRVTLTGTPVENRLDELWSQFHFINRGLLGGRRDFRERYALPIAAGDSDVTARLRERIRPFLLRRLKRDVAPELPPRTEMVLRCELDRDAREVYEAVRLATREEVVRKLEAGGGVMQALEALLRLRQAACHSGLVPGKEAAGSAKIELLMENLDSVIAEEHRALVFSQWTSLLDLCEPHLERAGVPFLRLDGATRDRAGVVSRFQSADGEPVLLISLKAGGTGLNLTAADHVFLLDPWWNPAVEDQAADRAHRIGQERPVMIYRLVAEETVEERILLLQERKRELAAAALDGADRASALTRDDLLDLLR